jgi:hypothetical protein
LVHNYNFGALATAIRGLAGDALAPEAIVTLADGTEVIDNAVLPQALLETVAWTGGGIRATAADTNRLMEAIYDGTLLDPASYAAMTTPTLDTDYGLGLSVGAVAGEAAIGHGGGVPGFRSDTVYLLDHDIAITVLTNGIAYEPDVGSLTEALVKLAVGS